MNEENEAAAHCAIGPSTLPARAICPCHESAPGGADADSGTRSHKVVESHLDGIGDPAEYYLPGTTEDEISRGIWGANTIRRLRDETVPGEYIYTEQRVNFNEKRVAFDFSDKATLLGKFGTVDACWLDEANRTLYIADYKTYAVGDSEKNYCPQGMAYAALLHSTGAQFADRAVFYVVAAGDRTVARYEFSMAEAIAETVATIRRVEAVREGGLFQDGEEARTKCGKPSSWCKTCKHSATCPAISRAVEVVSGGGILQHPLAVRMAIVPVLESFIKGVKAEVRATLDGGGRVFDVKSGIEYALASRHGRSKLKDLRGLAEAVVGYGVAPDEFAAAVNISKTAVEGLMKAADEREGRKVKKADREAIYVGYFSEPPLERYVKRIS